MSFHLFTGLDSLVYALLHTLWQGGLIVILLSALLHFAPVRRAQLRYLLSILALASVLFGGICTWAWLDVSTHRPPEQTAMAAPVSLPRLSSEMEKTPVNSAPEAFPSHSATFQWEPQQNQGFLRDWIPWLAAFWACGVAVFLIRSVTAILGAEQLCRQAREVTDPEIIAMAEDIRAALGMGKRIRLLGAEQVNMPAVIGMIRPAVLLPASLVMGLPSEYLRAVLAHEFAHIRRWDYLVNVGQMLLEALLFFNPFVWWISRQVRCEREACCDLIASMHSPNPNLYLEAVLACAERADQSKHEEGADDLPAAALALRGPNGKRHTPLLERAKRLLSPGYRGSVRIPWLTIIGMFVVTSLILFAMGKGIFLAARMLTPQQRIDRIEQIKKEFAPEPVKEGKIEVSGTVVTEDGKPLTPNVNLVIDSHRYQNGYVLAGACIRDGKFSNTIQSGAIRVGAWDEGYAPVFVGPLRGDADLKDLRLVLTKGFSATIHVSDPQGKPLEGVQLTGQYDGFVQASQIKIVTDVSGDARIRATNAVKAVFEVSKAGFQTDRRKDIRLDAQHPLKWVMVPAQLLKGRVIAEDSGAPVPNAKIGIINIAGPMQMSYDPRGLTVLATTNEQGEFTLDTLRDNSAYWLHIQANGYQPTVSSKLTVPGGPVEIKLGPALSITGKVVLPKSDSLPATVEVECRQDLNLGNHSQGVRQTVKAPVTDGVASFAFADLYAAETELWVNGRFKRLPQFQKSLDDLTVDMSALGPLNLKDIPKRWLVVRFDSPKDAPLPAGSFKLNYLSHGSGPGVVRAQRSKEMQLKNGEAWVELPGPNELEISPEGLVGYSFPRRSSEKLAEGTATAEIRLPVTPAGSIYGDIAEADGKPGYGIFISVLETNKSTDSRHPVLNVKNQAGGISDVMAQFVATPLPLGGEYAVLLQRDATVALGPLVRVNEKTPIRKVRIVIPEGTTVRGRVTDKSGNPVPAMEFELLYSTPWEQNFGSGGYWTQGDGRFAIPHVNLDAPGKYRLQFRTRSTFVPMDVIIDSKQPELNIRLRKGKVITGVALDAVTGLPMPGQEIYAASEKPLALAPGDKPDYYFSEAAEAPTDDQGRFRFSNLPEGKFRFGSRNGNLATPYEHTVVESGQSEPVTLKLKPVPSR